jgi:hypothetical protein
MATSEHGQKETPVPDTIAKDGRRNLGAYVAQSATPSSVTQEDFLPRIFTALSVERVEAYAQDNPEPHIKLARYLLNMALCESLYSPLQLCEIALRNSIHRHLTALIGREDWFDCADFELTAWAVTEIGKACDKLSRQKKDLTPGRIIAELQLGFWTHLFEAHYEQRTRFLPGGIKAVFPRLPKSRHHRKQLKHTLENIRALRNRIFHHERIIHWTDLTLRHAEVLQVIAWISPELHEMALALDRFTSIRSNGLMPWIEVVQRHIKRS